MYYSALQLYTPQDILDTLTYCCCCLVIKSCLTLATPWTVVCQSPRFITFFRQEYWSGLLFPSPGDLPHPEIEPAFWWLLLWQAGSLLLRHQGSPYLSLLPLYSFITANHYESPVAVSWAAYLPEPSEYILSLEKLIWIEKKV